MILSLKSSRRRNGYLWLVLHMFVLCSCGSAQDNHLFGDMWTFDNPPLDYVESEYGFRPTSEWLERLQSASLRIGGEQDNSALGSGAFVSPNGLILTSIRNVRAAVAKVHERDLQIINDGFYAERQEDEFRLLTWDEGWLSAWQLRSTTEVTDRVFDGIAVEGDPLENKELRDKNKLAILEEAKKANRELKYEIIELHGGSVCMLYGYKVYKDVRLVFMPHMQVAHFGAEEDNLRYPRHAIDFAFVRVYDGDKPLDTSDNYLTLRQDGVEEGETVFVSGSPALTNRYWPENYLEVEREFSLPMRIEELSKSLSDSKSEVGLAFDGAYDPENPSDYWSWVRTSILTDENDFKVAKNQLEWLEGKSCAEQMVAIERRIQKLVEENEQWQKEYEELQAGLLAVAKLKREYVLKSKYHVGGHPLMDVALDALRYCDPNESEEVKARAKEHIDSWHGGSINLNYYYIVECQGHYERARKWLDQNDPLLTDVLRGMNGEDFINHISPTDALRSPSWFGFSAPRMALIESGWEAIQSSEEPVIVAARKLLPLVRAQEQMGREIQAREEALFIRMGRLLSAADPMLSSDATFSPRFSAGRVQGYRSKRKEIPAFTSLSTMYRTNVDNSNSYPYTLPTIWLNKKSELDLNAPVDFVCTADMATGAAGSVVVDKDLQIVGCVIDGNEESVGGYYSQPASQSRTIITDSRIIDVTISEVYQLKRLISELEFK